MKKKGSKPKLTVADFLKTPSPAASPSDDSPKSRIFSRATSTFKAAKSVAVDLTGASPPRSNNRSLSNTSDLKKMASSGVDDLKCLIDCSHSEILNDLEASQSRLHKHFKMQTQACQQVMDEADKEYKKVSERITESREAMTASYEEFIAEAQASASRACKTSITELSQKFEKTVDSLRNLDSLLKS